MNGNGLRREHYRGVHWGLLEAGGEADPDLHIGRVCNAETDVVCSVPPGSPVISAPLPASILSAEEADVEAETAAPAPSPGSEPELVHPTAKAKLAPTNATRVIMVCRPSPSLPPWACAGPAGLTSRAIPPPWLHPTEERPCGRGRLRSETRPPAPRRGVAETWSRAKPEDGVAA